MSPALPLALPPVTRPPARRVVRHLSLVGGTEQPTLPLRSRTPVPPDDQAVPPDVERAARAVTVVVAEVLSGRRPVGQVESFADGPVLATIVQLTRSGLARGLALRSVRVQGPARGAAEVSFHLGDAVRSRAGALRVERGPGGWRCVALEVALAPDRVSRCG